MSINKVIEEILFVKEEIKEMKMILANVLEVLNMTNKEPTFQHNMNVEKTHSIIANSSDDINDEVGASHCHDVSIGCDTEVYLIVADDDLTKNRREPNYSTRERVPKVGDL